MSATPTVLVPADPRALADVALLVARASRADPGGAVRLTASGALLALTVCPVRGAGVMTVLGVRALALAQGVHVDTTVELAALADRLAHSTDDLAVPPVEVVAAAWAGVAPPRRGWSPLPAPEAGALALAAQEAQAAAGGGGAAGLASAWTTLLPGPLGAAGGTTALAGAALALGFVDGVGQGGVGAGSQPSVRAGVCGPWLRISTSRGDVVGRVPLLG